MALAQPLQLCVLHVLNPKLVFGRQQLEENSRLPDADDAKCNTTHI